MRPFSAFAALSLSYFAAGCFSGGEGHPPPLEQIYFPVGLALTDNSEHLIIANSDFDLQFNAGTLAVLKVGEFVERFVPKSCAVSTDCADDDGDTSNDRVCDSEPNSANDFNPSHFCILEGQSPCGDVGDRPAHDKLIHPGRCNYVDPEKYDLFSDNVFIGAFATDVVYRARPGQSGGRVFVPVRGDATLHFADVDSSGQLSCGQDLAGGACDDAHRAGNDPAQENTRDLRMDEEPYAIDVSPQGDAVLVTNQVSGTVSLFENNWDGGAANGLSLQFAVTGLPLRPIGAASVPEPGLLRADLSRITAEVERTDPDPPELLAKQQRARADVSPAFLVTYRSSVPQVDLIRSYLDQESGVERPYAARAGSIAITVNSSGLDTRGIAVDPSSRQIAEGACAAAVGKDTACFASPSCMGELSDAQYEQLKICLTVAASTSLDVYAASRSPASLMVGRTTPAKNAWLTTQLPAFYDTIPLTLGPSRTVVGRVVVGVDALNRPVFEPRVFVSCFDSRRVFIYDPVRRLVETEVTTGRGPYAMAVDWTHNLLFVGLFTDSYVSAVSLDRRFPHTYAKVVATLGRPTAPRASK